MTIKQINAEHICEDRALGLNSLKAFTWKTITIAGTILEGIIDNAWSCVFISLDFVVMDTFNSSF